MNSSAKRNLARLLAASNVLQQPAPRRRVLSSPTLMLMALRSATDPQAPQRHLLLEISETPSVSEPVLIRHAEVAGRGGEN